MEEILYLFVYGTLKRTHKGHNSERLRNESDLVSDSATVYGSLYDLGSFPGLKLDNDCKDIAWGHLVKLHDEKSFDWLDNYEGVDRTNSNRGLYRRELVMCILPETMEAVWAYTYVYNGNVSNLKQLNAWERD